MHGSLQNTEVSWKRWNMHYDIWTHLEDTNLGGRLFQPIHLPVLCYRQESPYQHFQWKSTQALHTLRPSKFQQKQHPHVHTYTHTHGRTARWTCVDGGSASSRMEVRPFVQDGALSAFISNPQTSISFIGSTLDIILSLLLLGRRGSWE